MASSHFLIQGLKFVLHFFSSLYYYQPSNLLFLISQPPRAADAVSGNYPADRRQWQDSVQKRAFRKGVRNQ